MKAFAEKYNRLEKFLLGLIMILLIVMGFVQVVFRFVLEAPLAWAEELMTFLMIWVAYLGSSAATNEKKHIIVSMFVDLLPGKAKLNLTVLSQIVWFACVVSLAYLGFYITRNYVIRGAVTLGGQYPFWAAAIAIPLSMTIIAIRILILIRNTIRGESDTIAQDQLIREEMGK